MGTLVRQRKRDVYTLTLIAMAIIHKLDQRKQADHRTALLGLAADQPASAGVCLLPEEMAELVEKCPPEKKELFFRHIAVCETCYREWLTLQDVLDNRIEGKKKPKIFKFLKPGSIALFGTLLAAAASVVVFLNINLPTKSSLTVPVESIRQEPAPPPVREEEKPRPVVQEKDTLPAPEKSVQKPEPSRKKQMPVSVDAVKAKRSAPAEPAAIPPAPAPALKKDLSAPPEQALPKASGEAATDGAVRPQAAGRGVLLRQNRLEAGAAVFAQWLEQLESGCREGRTSDAFWQEMEQKGREIKARTGELLPDEQKNLENLLLAVTGIEKKNVPERCLRILDLLAEERKGRQDGLQ